MFGGGDGLVCLSRREQVLPQRGQGPRPPAPQRLALGSNMAIMPPSGAPLETAGLQVKCRGVQRSVPFGAAMDSSAFYSRRAKYCHSGAWPSPTTGREEPRRRGAGQRVRDRHHGPRRGPKKLSICREKALGVRSPRPLEAAMDSLALSRKGTPAKPREGWPCSRHDRSAGRHEVGLIAHGAVAARKVHIRLEGLTNRRASRG